MGHRRLLAPFREEQRGVQTCHCLVYGTRAISLISPYYSGCCFVEQAANLVATLEGPGPFTVFAPTDGAFNALPPAVLAGLLRNKEALTAVLTYHVVAGAAVTSFQLRDREEIKTVEGSNVTVGSIVALYVVGAFTHWIAGVFAVGERLH